MSLTIVDYDGGNLRSVQRACNAVGLDSVFTQDPEQVRTSRRIIFPGVGNAHQAIQTLRASGLDDALREALRQGALVLGICVGAQLVLERTEESPLPALGLLPGETRRFRLAEQGLKVPHIGWNEVRRVRDHFLLTGLQPGDEFYFVHSYYLDPKHTEHVYCVSDYGGDFCCALGHENLFAVQFHPEKSGRFGLSLLERFSRWKGEAC